MGLFGLGRKPAVENLSIEAVKQGLADGSILLVDVREPHEWTAGHIPGSILAPLSSFDPLALPERAGRRLVLSCRSGRRSLTAAAAVHQAGLVADAHYAGGFLDWVAHGEPVATGD